MARRHGWELPFHTFQVHWFFNAAIMCNFIFFSVSDEVFLSTFLQIFHLLLPFWLSPLPLSHLIQLHCFSLWFIMFFRCQLMFYIYAESHAFCRFHAFSLSLSGGDSVFSNPISIYQIFFFFLPFSSIETTPITLALLCFFISGYECSVIIIFSHLQKDKFKSHHVDGVTLKIKPQPFTIFFCRCGKFLGINILKCWF